MKSNLFLESPNTYKLKWLNGRRGEHNFLPMIKECALTSFNVNYPPDGNYATFEDGIMTKYSMTLAFSELEPIFNSDYAAFSQDEIGY